MKRNTPQPRLGVAAWWLRLLLPGRNTPQLEEIRQMCVFLCLPLAAAVLFGSSFLS